MRGKKGASTPAETPRPVLRLLLTCHLSLLTNCSITPLTNKIRVGEEPFVIVVGEGRDGETDLFAAPAGGGAFVRLTFNRPAESVPAISPNGGSVAFLRTSLGGPPATEVIVLDLHTNVERALLIPAGGGPPDRLGWSHDGATLFIHTPGGLFGGSARGSRRAEPVGASERQAGDSALTVLLGDPVFGKVIDCGEGETTLCVRAASGETTPLGPGARDPFRWGSDSVAYLNGEQVEVRPLGGGKTRRPIWKEAPAHLRSPTYHPGNGAQVARETGLSGRAPR